MSKSGNGSRGLKMKRTLWNLVLSRLHYVGMILLMLGLYAFGIIPGIDRALVDLRFLLFPRNASGNIVIVQIDSKSLQEFGEWPWSRSLHAEVINKLSVAGVSRIGIDIDFSSRSSGVADNDLLKVIAESEAGIVLPIFKQWSSTRGGEITTTAPMGELAERSLLGSVNVRPATDGLVRKYDRLHAWDDGFVPSFATKLIGRATEGTTSFYVDYSIKPETIPRVSFVDVLRGNYDARELAGKYVIIGATALELGDEIAVPLYGALSGVELQALSAESILLGRTITQADTIIVLGVALVIGGILSNLFIRLPHVRGTISFIVTAIAIVLLAMIVQTFYPIDIPVGATLVTTAYCFVHGLTRQLDLQALTLFKSSAEIRERRALNQAIADNSFTGIIVADHVGKIRFANKAASEMLMVSQGELFDRDVAKVILPDDKSASLVEPTSAQSKIYTSLKIAGNHSLPVEIAISKISVAPHAGPFERRTTDRQFTIYAISDISVYKQTEEVLSRAAEQAAEANRTKTEFIANMSHELRTPLNAILGFSETIKSEVFGPVGSAKYKNYAEDIFTSGKHLLAIINDLLEISRLTAGKAEVHATPVDLNGIVQECIHIATGYPGANNLDISTHVDGQIDTIWTDERILKQIILNLLSNAIKFTPANGKISISAKLSSNGGTEITVEDTGIGIPSDQINRVLEPFHQIESSMQRTYHGSGLGLHLVKSHVALLGGTLNVESKIRVGTRIVITFPPENTVTVGKIVNIDRKQ